MKTYTIIGGVNGVGKPGVTGVLKESYEDFEKIIDVDKIAAELDEGRFAGVRPCWLRLKTVSKKGYLLHAKLHFPVIEPNQRQKNKRLRILC